MAYSFSVDLGFPLEAFVMLSGISPPLRLQYDLRLFAARGLCLILVELHFFFPESLQPKSPQKPTPKQSKAKQNPQQLNIPPTPRIRSSS